MTTRVLIVDDEEIVVRSCQRILADGGFEIDAACDGWEALRRVDEHDYNIIILDVMMPKIDGLEVLQHVKERHPDTDVIMVTGLSQIQTAVKSMKLGAFDYLSKPFDPDELRHVVDRALERQRLLAQNRQLKHEVSTKYRFDSIVGASAAMQKVYQLIAKCAPTNSTVLITGESGTGKEMIARAVHHNSLRSAQAFVAVDCNTLSEHLLESELFGHVKGAFTGAVTNKRGVFEAAHRGTLFIDELGNLPLPLQAKLLRVIQEREFRPVGSSTDQKVDVRIVAATNMDLKAMVTEHSFREDLYYRVNVFPIHSPPLRERRQDIPALALHFLQQFSQELGRPVPQISEGAMSLLMHHDWPGNVRELENTLQRATILASDDIIRQAHLADLVGADPRLDLEVPRTSDDLKRIKKQVREKSVEEVEKLFIQETLRRNHSNVTRSAEETGMQRANFQALMKKYGIRVRDTEPDRDDAGPM
ncbi:MAG: sigma-54-dependent Fis family transcriptional regulator [Vitreoscilla sp.]|nr:sigma-54-dependent Fis family transcriptional regulator [Vitreoscilla sp.]